MVATNLRASLNYLILIQNAATKTGRLISYEIPLVVWLRVDNFLSLISTSDCLARAIRVNMNQ